MGYRYHFDSFVSSVEIQCFGLSRKQSSYGFLVFIIYIIDLPHFSLSLSLSPPSLSLPLVHRGNKVSMAFWLYIYCSTYTYVVQYCWSVMQLIHVGGVGACLANDTIYCCKNSERERERERESHRTGWLGQGGNPFQ